MSDRDGTLFPSLRPQRWGDLTCLDWGWFYAEWGHGRLRLRFGRLSFYWRIRWSRV